MIARCLLLALLVATFSCGAEDEYPELLLPCTNSWTSVHSQNHLPVRVFVCFPYVATIRELDLNARFYNGHVLRPTSHGRRLKAEPGLQITVFTTNEPPANVPLLVRGKFSIGSGRMKGGGVGFYGRIRDAVWTVVTSTGESEERSAGTTEQNSSDLESRDGDRGRVDSRSSRGRSSRGRTLR